MRFVFLSLLVLVLAVASTVAISLGASAVDLLIGLSTGTMAALAWATIDEWRRRSELRAKLKRLEGTYQVRRKGDRDHVVGTVVVTLDGTVLRTKSPGSGSAGSWNGELIMNESQPSTGSGSYFHTAADGWGMHTVQVRGDELLVHSEYVKEKQMVADAYVWTPGE